MSVESIAIVLHHSKAQGTAKLVAIGIANHDGDGGAWPSMATLAKYANVTTANARKAVARLRALGEIAVDVQAGGTHETEDHMRPNRYRLLLVCPPWCDRTPQHRDTRRGALGGPSTGLWINPPSNPRGARNRGGDPHSEPRAEPPIDNPVAKESAPGTDRPREDRGPCTICGAADYFTHSERNARVHPDDRHPYTPRG